MRERARAGAFALSALLGGCTLVYPTSEHQGGGTPEVKRDAGAVSREIDGGKTNAANGDGGTTSEDAGGHRGQDGGDALCPDADGDGFTDRACGGHDCDDTRSSVYPGAQAVCADDVINDCEPEGSLTFLRDALYPNVELEPEIGRLQEVTFHVEAPNTKAHLALASASEAGQGLLGWVEGGSGHRIVQFDLTSTAVHSEPQTPYVSEHVKSLDLRSGRNAVKALFLLDETNITAFARAGQIGLGGGESTLFDALWPKSEPTPAVIGRAVVIGGGPGLAGGIPNFFGWTEVQGTARVVGGVGPSVLKASYRSAVGLPEDTLSNWAELVATSGPHLWLWDALDAVSAVGLSEVAPGGPYTWTSLGTSQKRPLVVFVGETRATPSSAVVHKYIVGRARALPAPDILFDAVECAGSSSCAVMRSNSVWTFARSNAPDATAGAVVRKVFVASAATPDRGVEVRPFQLDSLGSDSLGPPVGEPLALFKPNSDAPRYQDLRVEAVETQGGVSILVAAWYGSDIWLSGLRACDRR